eukprot:TRINITY_DN4064_c0_g1_i1.p1 TRINITY_DN4064_c0_g1~~TRINITY_DN4064_c0_g1_i1.p1  ORF type:complete len:159 (-),score=34.61 TRINITY_DN4064_c0_g1_i1:173-649(-)
MKSFSPKSMKCLQMYRLQILFADEHKKDHQMRQGLDNEIHASEGMTIAVDCIRKDALAWTEFHIKLLKYEEDMILPHVRNVDQPLEDQCQFIKEIIDLDRDAFLAHQVGYVTEKLHSMRDFSILRTWVDLVKRTSNEIEYRGYTSVWEAIIGGEFWKN